MQPLSSSDPPTPPVVAQRAPLLGWIAKYLLLPLAPFLVGLAIRWVWAGEISWRCFDPAELSFSLAMLCLFGVASARRLDDAQSREVAFAVFVVGVAIFISMFAFSIVELSRLESSRHLALQQAVTLLGSGASAPADTIEALHKVLEGNQSEQILARILYSVVGLGAVFVLAGLVFRDRYGLGEE